jgi:hypothetical protein
MQHRRRSFTRWFCALALAVAALLLASCGGSSSTSSPTATHASSVAKAPARTTIVRGRDRVSNKAVTYRPLHGTGGGELNDDNPGNADVGNQNRGSEDPCTLVSRAEGQAILGGTMSAPSEAPQGPTCIYQRVGSSSFVTLAIDSSDLANIRAHIHGVKSSRINGLTAICGVYGQPTTFVALSSGRVLSITAPCAVGRRFATAALKRLKA